MRHHTVASLKTSDVLDIVWFILCFIVTTGGIARYCKTVRGMFCSFCDKCHVACAMGVHWIQCLASFLLLYILTNNFILFVMFRHFIVKVALAPVTAFGG